jgi:nitrous oxidase accessory protein
MNKSAALLLVLVLAAFNIITFLPVKANSRTIVVPDDYSTIAAAIGNASQGDTVFVKKGIYEEHSLVINETITLVGEDKNATVIHDIDPFTLEDRMFHPLESASIRFAADRVKVTGFTLTGGVYGIDGVGNGTQIFDNNIRAKVVLKGSNQTIMQNSINYGLHCTGSHNVIDANEFVNISSITISGSFNVVCNNTITDEGTISVGGNSNIIAKNNLGYGIIAEGSDNLVSGNFAGTLATSGYNNSFIANDVFYGVRMGSSKNDAVNVSFCCNNFYFLQDSVRPVGEKIFEVLCGVHGPVFFDNGEEGNYWSDYNGADADGDGIGDTSYMIHANATENYEFTADFDISNMVLTDHHPLMSPFDISSVAVDLPPWETPSFELPQSKLFPTMPIAVASGVSVVVGVGLLVYFRKRNRQSETRLVKKS